METLTQLLARQSGVVSRRQARALGLDDHDVRRLLRRREWAHVCAGVYVDHTGPLSWRQRAWAAVLATAPSALCHSSAIRALDREPADDGRPIHVAVERDRVVAAPPGVVVHRLAHWRTRVLETSSPPRQRHDDAVLDVAAGAADDLAAISVLAAAAGSRRTTAERLRATLARRARIPRRAFLDAVLVDVATGTCSVLEHGYLDLVERAHGLPTAGRQVRESAHGTLYRDVDLQPWGLLVELDGRAVHGTAEQVDADLDRDLQAAVTGRATVRLGWGQVHRRPCATAQAVGLLLQQRGWTGTVRHCGRAECGGSQSPGDCDPPHSA